MTGPADTRASNAAPLWTAALVVIDAAAVVVATLVAYYARFEGVVPSVLAKKIPLVAGSSVVLYLALFAAFGLYRLVLRHVGVDAVLRTVAAVLVGFALLLGADLLLPKEEAMRVAPVGVLFVQALLVLLAAGAARLSSRVLSFVEAARGRSGMRILIIGAGDAGSLLLRDIEHQSDLGLHPVGFLDDSPALKGRNIRGVAVLGPTSRLAHFAAETAADEVFIAMPSAPADTVRRILNDAADAGLKTRIMPQLVIGKGTVGITDLRTVEVEDLLGREPAPIDVDQVRHTIEGRVVAVTGAAGSIGSELCRQIMSLGPKRLVLLEIDETRLYELMLELSAIDPDIPVMHVCDVRDPARLASIFAAERPEVVLHAAAYKHVPVMELAPAEAVKANVLGTRNVIAACVAGGAERFVLISTDKAVAPKSVMGATKSLAERCMLSMTEGTELMSCAVRFGNVLASRGSVVPIFQEQLRRGGPLTVTHPEVTRYFMTVPEAARLVLQAQAIGTPGDIFVLDMGQPVRIVDLAHKMIALSGVPADVSFVGLRPAEKLHEILTHEDEELLPTGRERILRLSERPAVPDGFAADVDALVEVARADDADGVVERIEALLPGFADRDERD